MIEIPKSQTADTRTCDFANVTKEALRESSEQHIFDVNRGLCFFSNMLMQASVNHDNTKISSLDLFHKEFVSGFKTTEWYKMHQREERHHLKDSELVQEDVNLIDILEMITDGVMAGMARSGEYRKEEISDELLRKAFDNTIKILLENVSVKKGEVK